MMQWDTIDWAALMFLGSLENEHFRKSRATTRCVEGFNLQCSIDFILKHVISQGREKCLLRVGVLKL